MGPGAIALPLPFLFPSLFPSLLCLSFLSTLLPSPPLPQLTFMRLGSEGWAVVLGLGLWAEVEGIGDSSPKNEGKDEEDS